MNTESAVWIHGGFSCPASALCRAKVRHVSHRTQANTPVLTPLTISDQPCVAPTALQDPTQPRAPTHPHSLLERILRYPTMKTAEERRPPPPSSPPPPPHNGCRTARIRGTSQAPPLPPGPAPPHCHSAPRARRSIRSMPWPRRNAGVRRGGPGGCPSLFLTHPLSLSHSLSLPVPPCGTHGTPTPGPFRVRVATTSASAHSHQARPAPPSACASRDRAACRAAPPPRSARQVRDGGRAERGADAGAGTGPPPCRHTGPAVTGQAARDPPPPPGSPCAAAALRRRGRHPPLPLVRACSTPRAASPDTHTPPIPIPAPTLPPPPPAPRCPRAEPASGPSGSGPSGSLSSLDPPRISPRVRRGREREAQGVRGGVARGLHHRPSLPPFAVLPRPGVHHSRTTSHEHPSHHHPSRRESESPASAPHPPPHPSIRTHPTPPHPPPHPTGRRGAMAQGGGRRGRIGHDSDTTTRI